MSNINSNDLSPSLNPYEASRHAEAIDPRLIPPEAIYRDYRVRMEWSDRHRFLRAVGPLRLAAMAGGVVGVWAVYGLIGTTFRSWQLGPFGTSLDFLMLGRIAFSFLRGALTLYLCWSYWKLADALAATAGGQSSNMNEWSALQLRIARLVLITVGLGFVSLAWDWMETLFLFRRLAAP